MGDPPIEPLAGRRVVKRKHQRSAIVPGATAIQPSAVSNLAKPMALQSSNALHAMTGKRRLGSHVQVASAAAAHPTMEKQTR